ncbi:ABC transporter permease [Actinomadura parmotrematis]|uniref:Transport permease protein n=1 Tax=Actinomadura parmotrematis TaxID=2864039 RepID=A0ABS7FMB9_9ACTN|nr:ABC transporter permease [Actinomadura parmotrematis]MBW8481514.1 ABC transporter permease [Actinomadura parmotrematis]
MSTAGTARDRPAPLRRFEPAAFAGVWRHEIALFKRYYRPQTFASMAEPTFFLLAFGYGFGSLVAMAGGMRYLDFVATGVVGTAALFTSVFPAMFSGYSRRVYQHTYDAFLAAPVDVHELVAGEALWIAGKAALYSCTPVVVGLFFGLRPSPWVLLVPLVTFLSAAGFGLFGTWAAAAVPSINSFDYVITGVVTPAFLVAGTFFPASGLPGWARYLAQANPLYHCVELVRHAAFGAWRPPDAWHAAALALFAAWMWTIAVRRLRRRLID